MVYKVANGVLVLTGALSLVVVLAACPSATYYWAFYANSHDLFCSDQVSTTIETLMRAGLTG